MGYSDHIGVILYLKPYQNFVIYIAHHVWFDEYSSHLSIENKHTPGYLLFDKVLKVVFIIQNSSTWFHVKLILDPLHFLIQQSSHIKLRYLPLEIKLVLIYLMIKILWSHMSLIQYQTHHLFSNFHHILNKMWGSYLSMGKRLSKLKLHLINSISIKLHMYNLRSGLVYAEGRVTR